MRAFLALTRFLRFSLLPGIRAACGLGAVLLLQAVPGQLRITEVAFEPPDSVRVTVPGGGLSYYLLYRGDEVTQIVFPVAMAFGDDGPVALRDSGLLESDSRFYRVAEHAVTDPADSDGDGIDDVYELALAPNLDPLDASDAGLDPDGDGATTLEEYERGSNPFEPDAGGVTTVLSSPDQLETGVSVNRETVFHFSRALAADTVMGPQTLFAEAAGRRLLTRVELSTDRRKASLFYLEPTPGATRVRVTLLGDAVLDTGGRAVDADGDGRPGGVGILEFETFGNRALANTAVIGQVFASELTAGAGGQSVNRPLPGVIITVDGAEETLRAVTDAEGRFRLEPAPAGRFFVHIDGRQATGSAWPDGSYYPVVGKAWEAVPGRADNLAGETGIVYLPLVPAETLRPVSETQTTPITFPPAVLAQNPELAGVEVLVPPNALFSDNGSRGGRVGIAPVAPDRIPSPLPPGLELPLVITIQTDGPQNFDRPVPVRFPNLPDPVTGETLPPGGKSALWSFNHDTGNWELMGPMTVTPDGLFVETDPGVGVLQPGWHGTRPGVSADKGPLQGPCTDNPSPGTQNCRQNPNFDPADPANYNGCGPDGFDYLVPDNPNGLLNPCASFFDACKAHDIGYNTCGRPKQQTDDQFLQDMLAACECLVGLARLECRAKAVLYHRAVTGGGEDAFDAAQKQACVCDDPPPPADCGGGNGDGPSLLNTPGAAALARRVALAGPRPASSPGSTASLVPQLGPHRFAVVDLTTGQVVQRGQAGSAGIAFTELILAPNTPYDLALLQEATLREGKLRITTGPSGSRISLPAILVEPSTAWDFDGDGLHDVGELVMGTDYLNPDSDGDGVNDGAEVKQGTNPLDGTPLNTGVIASAATPGRALDIVALNDIAVTANDTAGVSLFNVSDPFAPTLLASVDTAGQARGVAFAGNLIAVADGSGGLAVVDATSPSTPFLVRQVNLGSPVNAVAVAGGIGYCGLQNGSLAQVELRSGTVLARLPAGAQPVQDVVIHGDTLHALAVGRLFLVPLDGGEFRVGGSVPSDGPVGAGLRRLRLFVGGGLAYATFTSGYNLFDVSNPEAPFLVRRNLTAQQGWKQIVTNGSGLGVATLSANSTDDGEHHVSLFQLGSDGTASDFVTTLPTPGLATAVALYNGLAYVADGAAGLQVLNYLAFDRAGQPPVITLEADFSLDPPQAEEGKTVRVRARVADDVQVRNVEFYVDGQRVVTDGNFEFEVRFTTPVRGESRNHFTLRARATDTGGNRTWTDEYTVALVPDATSPSVVGRFPRPGAIEGAVQAVAAVFSEPVQPATLNPATVRLISAGTDGVPGTADDAFVTGGVVEWRSDQNAVFLRLAQPLAPGFYEARLSPPIADLAGNALLREVVWNFWVLGQEDADADGVPDVVEPALGLDPSNPDTDGDGILDGQEDFDGDRLMTSWELVFGYDPRLRDSDGNGVNDEDEDPDADGVRNRIEAERRLNPGNADSDADGWDDNGELVEGTDPLSADSTPRLQVVTVAASFLNAIPHSVSAGTTLTVNSPAASYLNAVPIAPTAGEVGSLSSSITSYLNAVEVGPAAGTVVSVPSFSVSYLNSLPEPVAPGTTVRMLSPVVSYQNQ